MKYKIAVFMVLMGILVCANVFAGTSTKEILCYPLAIAPVMDGKIEGDKAWKDIARTDGNFFVFGADNEISKKKTYFRTGYDSGSLFIAVECEESDLQNIIAILKDEEALWSEDSIEVFIVNKATQSDTGYYQFITNAIGSRYNGISGEIIPLMKWDAKTSMGDKTWSAEIRIPFMALGIKPKKGDKRGFNICRNICSGIPELNTTWVMMYQSFHEPENFGTIIFR